MQEHKKIDNVIYELPKKGEMRVPVRAYCNDDAMFQGMNNDRTLMQAQNVATLPGIEKAMLVMPDGHEGYGFPVGGVAAFNDEEGIVSPGGIGYDISCGVRLIRTNLSVDDVKPKIKQLIDELYKNIPTGAGEKGRLRLTARELDDAVTRGTKWSEEKGYATREDSLHCEEEGEARGALPEKVSELAKKRGGPQFGTLGSGNHFAEVQVVDKILHKEAAKSFGLYEGQVCVMIHSGSRGFGHQIATDYIREMLPAADKYGVKLVDKELVGTPIHSKEAQNYIGGMQCGMNFAFNNRQVMTHWTRESFANVFKRGWEDMDMRLVYDLCHNNAKFEEYRIDGKRKKLLIHRKGATRAFGPGKAEVPQAYRKVGQPVLIPGSMNTASYVLVGQAGSEESFGSSCHGAGRTMSRHEALRRYNGQEIMREMEKKGQAVRSPNARGVAEEYGPAYKDVDAVVQTVEKAKISSIVAKLLPLGVIKG
ncbi:MAG TPA: RtcB family protein [Candidatus Norongarragalinales archaeon]|nr:RtcB family protein [Candidatus Norongarragalinales archaeon]